MTSPPPPVQLVCLSAVTWRFPMVGRSRMLTEAWMATGQPVVFVQVPTLRSGLERLTAKVSVGQRFPSESHVLRPWPVGPLGRWSRWPAERLGSVSRRRARELRAQLERRLDLTNSVALVVSPIWAEWLPELPFRDVVYDCIDDVAVHTPLPSLSSAFEHWERELLERCSGAIVSADSLRPGLQSQRPGLPLATVRNGVDAGAFQALAASSPRPADLAAQGRRPIVGFVGAVYEWFDSDLVSSVAAALPEFDFVIVGPADGRSRLPVADNIFTLGWKPYAQVPAYMDAFDVCWLPFRPGTIAATANPIKLYEYLALGKPVVSSPVADMGSFNGLVRFAADCSSMVFALREAMESRVGLVAERRQFAQHNSWAARAQDVLRFVQSLRDKRSGTHTGSGRQPDRQRGA